MNDRILTTIIAGQIAGQVQQHESGQLTFTYLPDYSGAPLSISMPIANRTYGDKQVRPYLFGLLPDDDRVRRNTGLEYDVSGNNPFALLTYVGLDCPGAVQFCPPEKVQEALTRPSSTIPVADADIAARLRIGRTQSDRAWVIPTEHWSLGGQQSKFALRLVGDEWHSCQGAAATTHIFKCGISHLAYQALNEYVCMKVADACTVPCAQVAYRLFEDEPAIIVTRYDRFTDANGSVERFHQEDFCQALGVLPENKYPEYGGPAAIDIVGLLKQTERFATDNLTQFAAMLFFNYLIGAPDAHAKNYSLLIAGNGDVRLAPLYDVASILPYRDPHVTYKVAMSIGGENRLGYVTRNAIERFAEAADLPAEDCVQLMATLARMIPERFAAVCDEAVGIPGMDELRERWEEPLVKHCEDTLKKL
ncbi:MAG: type II toxin-antitoxin system HipA family toxin [Eggerthellaceae bacterium]|nr:type II toxin-antitoxin system HipA family toxin [Eggerthellaceae bacterium]